MIYLSLKYLIPGAVKRHRERPKACPLSTHWKQQLKTQSCFAYRVMSIFNLDLPYQVLPDMPPSKGGKAWLGIACLLACTNPFCSLPVARFSDSAASDLYRRAAEQLGLLLGTLSSVIP